MIVIQRTILYWYRCDECGYESDDFVRELDADRSADRHMCPDPDEPLDGLDDTTF